MKRNSLAIAAALACAAMLAAPLVLADNKTYRVPRHLGMDVDHCVNETDDATCGQPAADAFCKSKGHAKADAFETRTRGYETIKLGTDHICRSKSCVSLYKVECSGEAAD